MSCARKNKTRDCNNNDHGECYRAARIDLGRRIDRLVRRDRCRRYCANEKPAPDIYQWVLNQLKLTAQQCIAIEDSENGLKSALAANLPTLITVSGYTRSQDFNGAIAVLSDLGEPSQPFTQIKNMTTLDRGCVDYKLLSCLINHQVCI